MAFTGYYTSIACMIVHVRYEATAHAYSFNKGQSSLRIDDIFMIMDICFYNIKIRKILILPKIYFTYILK